MHLSIFILVINQLDAQNFVFHWVYFMPLHVSSTRAHHQDVKIVLYSLWYHHTYMCDDTRGCVMQFWPPDDEHICSKHVGEWNKLTVKQKFCALSWLTDKTLFHSMQKCGEGTRQVKADRKLVGRKKCDVKLGEVSQKWEKLYLMIIILMVIYQV